MIGDRSISNYKSLSTIQAAIISLNRNDNTVALGIIESVEGADVLFRSPLGSLKGINRVVCGDMTMS